MSLRSLPSLRNLDCSKSPVSFQSRALGVAQLACVRRSAPPFPCRPAPFVSLVRGVAQLASATVLRLLSLLPASLFPFRAGVPAIGVGHGAICAISDIECPNPLPDRPFHFSFIRARRSFFFSKSPMFSAAVGVGHEPKSLSDVRRADATSWQYGRPAGVAFAFQVSENSVEPTPSNRRFNLLSKDDCRAALGDERKPRRPQVTFVIGRLARACDGEWLTRARACPNRSVVWPACNSERDRPSSDASEEMGLCVAAEVVGPHVNDASLVNVSWGDVPFFNEVAEPLRGIRINLVVVGGHSDAFIGR